MATEIVEHAADDVLMERESEAQARGGGHLEQVDCREALYSGGYGEGKRIAAQLYLSERTVKEHMKSILPNLPAGDPGRAVIDCRAARDHRRLSPVAHP